MDKVSEAESCVIETSSIFPLSHQVAYMVREDNLKRLYAYIVHFLSVVNLYMKRFSVFNIF